MERWSGFVCRQCELDLAIWGNLPLDIQLQLLAHLPLPAVVRFQAVSKTWCNAIRSSIWEITVHGDCFVYIDARDWNKKFELYSSLEEGCLELPNAPYNALVKRKRPGVTIGTCNGLVCFEVLYEPVVCHVLTGRIFPIPALNVFDGRGVRFLGMQGGEDTRCAFILVHVCVHEYGTILRTYKFGAEAWESTSLRLPPEEEFTRSDNCIGHGTLHGSTLYFLTHNWTTREVCLRSIDVLKNIDGISHKLLSWTGLPFHLLAHRYFDLAFKLAVSGGERKSLHLIFNECFHSGNLFMGAIQASDPENLDSCTLVLLRFNMQLKQWDLESKMELKLLVMWPWVTSDDLDLRSMGEKLVVSFDAYEVTGLYNTTSKIWSLVPSPKTSNLYPLRLSMSIPS